MVEEDEEVEDTHSGITTLGIEWQKIAHAKGKNADQAAKDGEGVVDKNNDGAVDIHLLDG